MTTRHPARHGPASATDGRLDLPYPPRPIGRADLAPLDLARRAAGKLVGEVDAAGDLEARQALAGEGEDFAGQGLASLAARNAA